MDGRLRRVSKLRLCSREESLNRRGAVLVEDALRTASLPDGDGSRLWIVRKLSLGRIRAGDPPSAVALRIEARFRESGAVAVHAESPQAAAANAVYFDDDLEPYSALALRIARRNDVSGWFWPLAARGWTPALSRDDAIRVLLAGALASSAGAVAALALIRSLVRHGVLDVLATALRFQDGPSLLQAFAWTAPLETRRADFRSAPPPRPADAPSATLERMAAPWFTAWGATDARSLWLACALYATERPALSALPSLPPKAAAWIAATVHAPAEAAPSGPVAGPVFSLPSPIVEVEQRETEPALRFEEPTIPQQPEPRVHLFTTRAGLFFLIRAMHRLGMPRWLDENPHLVQWSVPFLVLRAIAHRLQTLPDDPAMAALGDLPADPPPEVDAAVREWIRRLRRFSRLTARIGLHSLICRPGRIVFTETHIDILFRLDRADIRIRRAGLDIDPGWAPWLARVVHFHYLADEAYDA
jgi:hypothetical protein